MQQLHDLPLLVAEGLGVLREARGRAGVGLLDPGHLHLFAGRPGRLEPLIDRLPILRPGRVVGVFDPGRGHAALGTVHDPHVRVLGLVGVGQLLERRELLRRVAHPDGEQDELAVRARLDLLGQCQPRGLVRRRPFVLTAGI